MQFLSQRKIPLNINGSDHHPAGSTVDLSTFSTPGNHALRRVLRACIHPSQTTRMIVLGTALSAPAMPSTAATLGATETGHAAPAVAGASSQPSAPTSGGEFSQHREYWLDLSEPALTSIGPDRPAERDALLARIERQQEVVLARVHELGGAETARLKELRNAVAVTLPAQAVPEAARIPGVLRVRPVQHRNRIDDRAPRPDHR